MEVVPYLDGKEEELCGQAFAGLVQYAKRRKSNVVSIFRSKDRDGSGALTRHEFAQVVREQLGDEYSDKKLHALFQRFDKNCDGVIDYPEFFGAIHAWQVARRKQAQGTGRVHNPARLVLKYSSSPGSIYQHHKVLTVEDIQPPKKHRTRTQNSRPETPSTADTSRQSSQSRSRLSKSKRSHRASSAHASSARDACWGASLLDNGPRFVTQHRSTIHAPTLALCERTPEMFMHPKQFCPGGRHLFLSKGRLEVVKSQPKRTHPTKLMWRTISGGYKHAPKESIKGGVLGNRRVPCDGLFS